MFEEGWQHDAMVEEGWQHDEDHSLLAGKMGEDTLVRTHLEDLSDWTCF